MLNKGKEMIIPRRTRNAPIIYFFFISRNPKRMRCDGVETYSGAPAGCQNPFVLPTRLAAYHKMPVRGNTYLQDINFEK
jgi:hypothetical protein